MIELGVTPTMIQPVILCGSSGTLLEQTARRCSAVASLGAAALEPLVICNEARHHIVQAQLSRTGAMARAILLEPQGRGTAPALTLAAVHSVTADDPVLLAMSSDRHATADPTFQRTVERGAGLAQQGFIVTFGVPSRAPETGCGYVRAGQPLGAAAAYVEAFFAKPDAAGAGEHLAFVSGRYLRDSGILAVRASVWLEAVALFRKDIFAACERAYRQGRRDGPLLRVDPGTFAACPSDSIDCAVMERLADESTGLHAVVVTLDPGASDVAARAARQPATRRGSARSP